MNNKLFLITIISSFILSIVSSLFVLSWLFRYDIEMGGDRVGYRLDRWFGNVDVLLVTEMSRVKQVD